MRTNFTRIAAAAAITLPCCTALASGRLGIGSPPVGYHMTGTYTHGCFDPCECPIMFTDQVTGSFGLSALAVKLGDPVQAFQITNMSITVGGPAASNPTYTGTGSYQILSGITVTHRMQLDLTTGPDGGFEHYDSGWIIGGFDFPHIGIDVSIHGMFCFDTAFGIDATPNSPADLDGDGHVDGKDLAMLLGNWGPCPICIIAPCLCQGDLNGDSQVNGLDLAIMLGSWG